MSTQRRDMRSRDGSFVKGCWSAALAADVRKTMPRAATAAARKNRLIRLLTNSPSWSTSPKSRCQSAKPPTPIRSKPQPLNIAYFITTNSISRARARCVKGCIGGATESTPRELWGMVRAAYHRAPHDRLPVRFASPSRLRASRPMQVTANSQGVGQARPSGHRACLRDGVLASGIQSGGWASRIL